MVAEESASLCKLAMIRVLFVVLLTNFSVRVSSASVQVTLPLTKKQREASSAAALRSPLEYDYFAEVQIAGNQTLEVLVDTGSPVFAVAASLNLDGPYYNGGL